MIQELRDSGIEDQRIEELRNWGIQGLINKIDRKHSIPKFLTRINRNQTGKINHESTK